MSSGEGGGEEQVWRSSGSAFSDAADVGDEAHVEHAIRFIQHQHFQGAQGERPRVSRSSRRPGWPPGCRPELDGVQGSA